MVTAENLNLPRVGTLYININVVMQDTAAKIHVIQDYVLPFTTVLEFANITC